MQGQVKRGHGQLKRRQLNRNAYLTILVGASLSLVAQIQFLFWYGLCTPPTATARTLGRVEGEMQMPFLADARFTAHPRNATETKARRSSQAEGEIADARLSDHASNATQMFPDGELNVLEPLLPGRCVSFRFRARKDLYSLEDATKLLKSYTSPLRIGIQFAEDPAKFLPVRIRETGNTYHMYHFVEFIVMAFASLAQLRAYPASQNDEIWTSATQISVPWLFSPHASRKEFCGGPSNINCLLADLLFRSSSNSSFQDHSAVIGLDEMDDYTFNATNPKDKGIMYRINAVKTAYTSDSRFAQADGMIKIERFGCNNGGINKPWHIFIDSFPSILWYNSIQAGLTSARLRTIEEESLMKLVACYIDRQNTDRRLPDEHHLWLVETIQSYTTVLFVQLHMEEYSSLEQIQKASRCNLMVGMHGNGLTHSLWMKPGSYVVEFFWKYNFQYDYATAAQLLKHNYLGIFNGRVVNETLIRKRDPSLRQSPTRREAQHVPVDQLMANFEEFGKPAFVQLLNDAIRQKHGRGSLEES